MATHMLRGGANVMAISALLGHASVTTTQAYLGVDDDHLMRARDLLPR